MITSSKRRGRARGFGIHIQRIPDFKKEKRENAPRANRLTTNGFVPRSIISKAAL
jgi:hypothetical protein